MVLSAFLELQISPDTFTVIFLENVRRPRDRGGDVGDVAHLGVRLLAMKLTLSGEIFPGSGGTPGTSRLTAGLPSVPTSRATRVTSEARELSWSTIVY